MEISNDDFMEVEIGSSLESLQNYLASQRELFHSQIDQFQQIVVTQCNLTGVNPLSQEMAAGALSIKIGKRPRDLINPKAVNYMQSIFSIKDVISKKESREISALLGVTVTQVRDFFNSQRSRVRRLVQLSRERALISNSCEEYHDGQIDSDPMRPINPVPLNSAGPANAVEASCSTQEATFSGLDDLDKHFVDNIFSLMRKEETFSGQEKLMEWILTVQNFSVLLWFLTKGGVIILATWLSTAAVEEQTSVLLLILKVLCHLPLHKALPTQISAMLQSVNRLRFYRTSDISNRARILLAKWSKLSARNQAMKKIHGVNSCSDGKRETMLSDSIGQIMGSESWHSNIDDPEDILALSNECSNDLRKVEPPQALKLLTPSSDDSNKKHVLGVSSSQSRERRKVQLMEQPGQKTASRSPQAIRAQPVSQGRPVSADDIQKAKMRAFFMQSKYGKTGPSKESKGAKINGLNKPQTNQASISACSSKVPIPSKIEGKKSLLLPSKTTNRLEASDSKLKMDLKEPLWEKCKRVQIPWTMPAEMILDNSWKVGAGQNSKEVEVEKNRNHRDKETIYKSTQEIPSNPNEPWDLEMDYDDTLTPEIPIEQLPDGDGDDDGAEIVDPNEVAAHAIQVQGVATTSSNSNNNAVNAEPDLELLAVLLNNPDLVFALTSGQGGSITNEETVKLLDMIKRGGLNLGLSENNANASTNANHGMCSKAPETVEVSLPSPTPSSDSRTSGWSTEASTKNPFSRQSLATDRVIHSSPTVATTNLLSQFPAAATTVRQQPPTTATVSRYPLPQANNIVPHALSSVHVQTPSSLEIGLRTMKNNIITANASSVNIHSAHSPLAMHAYSTSNVKPVPKLSAQEGVYNSFQQYPILTSQTPSSLSATQQQENTTHLMQQQNTHFSEPSYHSNPLHSYPPQIEKPGPVSNVWRVMQQNMPPNYHHSERNQNNYNNTLVGGSMQSDSSWDRNNHATREGYETWSPENSPTRKNPRSVPGRNFNESRMNSNHGRNQRHDWSRQQLGSSGHWDPARQGNKKWHDQKQ
ncbi:PREDICTED: homeobox protein LUMINIDEPENDENS-like isoform X2 [Lupinus angustifolius]|uniref:homeobox protein LUMINIDEPENDENS-like isoform X2 n=1 Tax=Lupinus angustifolius TaxID=3871 RepID=UPI00092F0C9E|nr:PREDICTED: homeobox protein LUMINIDEPENDENS-like isoform X2 [Lupinus angustifolius]